MEDKVAEYLEPRKYNVSVARAEVVATFGKHRSVSLEKARKAVDKAGFKYLSAQVAAHGSLKWAGEPDNSDLLLKDSKAELTLRLTASDTASTFRSLVGEYRRGNLGDTVQVRGTVIDTRETKKKANERDVLASLAVTAWSPGKSAKLPPLVPEKTRDPKKKQAERKANSGDGWF